MEAILLSLRRHQDNVTLQAAGLAALANLALSDTWRPKAADAIDLVLTAIAAFPDCEPLHIAGLSALSNLARSECCRLAIADTGGVEVIAAAVARHTGSRSVQDAATSALLNISTSDAAGPRCVGVGGCG